MQLETHHITSYHHITSHALHTIPPHHIALHFITSHHITYALMRHDLMCSDPLYAILHHTVPHHDCTGNTTHQFKWTEATHRYSLKPTSLLCVHAHYPSAGEGGHWREMRGVRNGGLKPLFCPPNDLKFSISGIIQLFNR